MTSDEMIVNIKSMLGYPQVDLEITDGQIANYIGISILMVKDHIHARRYKTFVVGNPNEGKLPGYCYSVNLEGLEFDVISEVYRGDLLTPYLYDQFYLVNYATRGVPAALAVAISMRSNMESLINRSWKVVGNTLYLDKYYNVVTVEFVPKIIGLEDIDDSYYINWVMRYATALSKEGLGRIRGKFTVSSNPYETDNQALLSEATAEKTQLMEELADRGYLDVTR